ncbi:hypothetical protein QR98_0100390 [Sarcoptes scabiei]|uniref:Ig-like domain-containing protein n=1 Tax=Sarcoptes scabiei TaxID=52283 RepID=A0A132AKB5_SARSC|nr:hypothetical protein QR98_0100390 [Sarcoptes scabiei]
MDSSSRTILKNIVIIRPPEFSVLTLGCDSFEGKPLPIIKWYRFETKLSGTNFTARNLRLLWERNSITNTVN